MKKIVLLLILCISTLYSFAQGTAKAKNILDRTAKIVGRAGGVQASFTISGGKMAATSGVLAVKGNAFHATTPKATVWYNGKTQWTYLKATNEVNISTPDETKRAAMNPYTVLSLYRSGYNLSVQGRGVMQTVHMVAQDKKTAIKEVYITVNTRTYVPTKVRMLQNGSWITITISNFKAKNLSNRQFSFNAKDFPTAEVIDLR